MTGPTTFGLDLEAAILGALIQLENGIPADLRCLLSPDLFSEKRQAAVRAILQANDSFRTCNLELVNEVFGRYDDANGDTILDLLELEKRIPSTAHLMPHVQALRQRMRGERSFTQPLSTLLSVPDEPIPYLIERLLVAAANGFIGGEPKSLKSWVALHIALCLGLGVRVFGRYPVPQPMRVLFISEEDGERRIKGRIWKLLMGLGMNPPGDDFFRYSIKAGIMLDDPEWIERLRAEMAEYKPGIVIGDVFELMHSKDGDKRSEMKPVFRNLDRLREEFSCGFLLADHFKKASVGTSKRGGQRLSGTVGKHAFGECSLYLFPTQGTNRVRVETELKDGPSEVFGLALEDTEDGGVVFTWQAEAEDREGEMKAKALAAVEGLALDGSWVRTKPIAEVMGVAPNTAAKYLNLLVDEDRRLDREQRKEGRAKPFFWRLIAF